MTRSSSEQIQEALAAVPTQQSLVGTFVSQVGSVATVIQGNTVLQVKAAAAGLVTGDPVRLERRNGELIMIGPSRPRATVGVIQTTGTECVVEYPPSSGVTALLPRDAAYTPAVNDIVALVWTERGGFISGKFSNTPAAPAPPLPPPVPTGDFDVTFTALDSGAYQGGYGWRTNEVWSSASNLGAWFYGSKIRDTIPDGAVIKSATIFLPLRQQLGAAPFGRHGSEAKPGGPVTFAGLSTLGSNSGWVAIPTSLIDHLKANPGGLGYDYGGYNIWRGTQQDGLSGALNVTYTA